MTDLNERELSIVRFALQKLINEALNRADWCARKENEKFCSVDSFDKYRKDAKDAEVIWHKLTKRENQK